MTGVLELSGITCRFDDGGEVLTALDDVSLTVDRGELVAVIGPSGSGKSTLIHVACGLIAPDEGTVQVLGSAPPGPGRGGKAGRARWWAGARRQSIGVIHQRLNLVPALSAIENVGLPLRLEGMARSRALAAATEALAEADAAGFAGARVDRLSTGQQQRVALARATVGGREIVLADEPTAALDTVGTERVAELLSKLAEAGRAVLMVTHDSRLATWADRVIVLRDGRVVDRLEPQLTSDPAAAVR